MRLFVTGCVAAAAVGCQTTRSNSICAPCSTGALAAQPGAKKAIPPASTGPSKPAAPAFLPPTVQEVRDSSDYRPDIRPQPAVASTLAPAGVTPTQTNQDVLLVPRWVYVPYAPHKPSGPARLPMGISNAASGPQMTVMPPMGLANPNSQAEAMEKCLQELKLLNARMTELEAKKSQFGQPMPTVSEVSIPGTPSEPPRSLPMPQAPASIPPAE